jgi:ribulose 1,5-bisphosphate synthetase/thiazole synthase
MKRSYGERSSNSPPKSEHETSITGSIMNGVVMSSEASTMKTERDVDHVIVIGAGPAGLMLA